MKYDMNININTCTKVVVLNLKNRILSGWINGFIKLRRVIVRSNV